MKTLIAYSSRHGSSEKIAHLLFAELGHGQVRLLDLRNEPPIENLDEFDEVIVGGSIHYGQIQQAVKDFCFNFKDELLKKRLGLYMCYMLDDAAEEEFNNAFIPVLRDHAIAHGYFGGELLIDKMNFLEKFVVHGLMKEKNPVYNLNEKGVDSFIDKMK